MIMCREEWMLMLTTELGDRDVMINGSESESVT